MRRCFPITILAAALCLLTTGNAAAYTEFGNGCTGNATEPGWTALMLGNGQPTPSMTETAGPFEHSGDRAVITRWKANLGPGMGPLPQQLVAFKHTETGVVNVGESGVETLIAGANEFATRIPVPDYTRIGLRGPAGTLFCDEQETHVLGVVEGDFPPGQERSHSSFPHKGVPVIAIAEADADGDGYGDETQDKCTTSALFHDACPSVAFTSRVEAIRRGAILFSATSSLDTPLEISGKVSWPLSSIGRGATRRAKAAPRRVVPLEGGTQQLAANVPAMLRIPLPKAVIGKLQRTPRAEHLRAVIRLRLRHGMNGVVSKRLDVKLHGHGRRCQAVARAAATKPDISPAACPSPKP